MSLWQAGDWGVGEGGGGGISCTNHNRTLSFRTFSLHFFLPNLHHLLGFVVVFNFIIVKSIGKRRNFKFKLNRHWWLRET
jgi:hypothetical protein